MISFTRQIQLHTAKAKRIISFCLSLAWFEERRKTRSVRQTVEAGLQIHSSEGSGSSGGSREAREML